VSWMIFPGNPALSLLVLFVVAMPFLYAARRPVHGVFASVCLAISQALRLGAHWLQTAANNLRSRNEIVLLAHGREEIAQSIDREFERVAALVRRDLQGYPALQRKLLDDITRIEEDYQKCGEVPPPPPEWTRAVEAIAQIKNTGDGLVMKILTDISESIEKIYDRVLSEYRRSYERRHRILEGFVPFGRSLNQTLTRVDRNITGLQESAARIDVQMEKYEKIAAHSEDVAHALTASTTTQFLISGLVLAVAGGGAFVNFWLIARPMAAMVGGGEYLVGGLETSHVAALVIIFVEATMGLFLMETLRITHLFPRINNMNDRMRRRMMIAALVILAILAGVEVALAVMRDQIITADIALKRGLSGGEAVAAPIDIGWVTKIPVAGQMVLGFILPFALAFIAVPLEYFIVAGRTVFGAALVLVIRGLAFLLRIGGNLFRHVNRLLAMLYDVTIFLPLFIERMVHAARRPAAVPETPAGPAGESSDDSIDVRKVG
jgi:hypothetical protein